MKKRIKKSDDTKKKNGKSKKKVSFSKIEFGFNVLSLVVAIGIGLYFGTRSFYYYSKQSEKLAGDALTLNGIITSSNYVVTDGDGLHQDTDGHYFKGNVYNNYVKFANRMFRVVRINNDGSVKLITQDIASVFMWGEDSNYVGSNLDKWLDVKENVNGSGVYYNTLPYGSDFLVKTEYNIPTFDGKSAVDGKDNYSSYVTTLSIKDYSNANGNNSYLNINKYYWLLGNGNDNSNLYVSEDGSLLEGSNYEAYGVRPVITLKPDTLISGGMGTSDNPYVINQGDKTNLVHLDVVLDNSSYKVFYDDGNILKLAYTNYAGGGLPYSVINSTFNPSSRGGIANYLNNDFYNSMSYKDLITDTTVYTGEVSSDTSLDFTNIYSNSITCKVGMINLFDYHILGGDNFFVANTTSNVGNMAYVYHNNGLLEEVDITEQRPTIAVITIKKNMVKLKEGTNTYIVR